MFVDHSLDLPPPPPPEKELPSPEHRSSVPDSAIGEGRIFCDTNVICSDTNVLLPLFLPLYFVCLNYVGFLLLIQVTHTHFPETEKGTDGLNVGQLLVTETFGMCLPQD